jgi:serine/threonine-protein kinase
MNFEFLGPYRVEHLLGQGGMGTVYRGVHGETNQTVAVKVIASSLADQERFRRRFAAEVETLKRLKHPHIVQLIGYGEEQGHLFYSMEYVNGKNLGDTLRKLVKLPWDRAIEIAIEVVSALKHAHDFGIIHRDLKPANVMLDENGIVKLTDFGIAKLFGSSDVTVAGSVIGTADFMPPEQAEGSPVSARSDLYALGALIYAMITGRSPHAAKTVPEVLYNVRYGKPTALDLIEPGTPIELSELVSHLLKKDMAERPPTALVVGNRLQSLRHGLQRRQSSLSQGGGEQIEQAAEFNSIDLSLDDANSTRILAPRAEDQTHVVRSVSADFRSEPTKESPPSNAADHSSKATKNVAADLSYIEEPAPAGKTRFTVVEEKERRRIGFGEQAHDDPVPSHKWWSVLGLIGLLIACVGSIGYFLRPASAEKLYMAISAAVDSGSEDALLDAEPFIDEFQSRFSEDARVEEIKALKSEIEQQRAERRLLRQARAAVDGTDMDPIEQAFLDCRKLENEQPDRALEKWKAFLVVFGQSEHLSDQQKLLLAIAEKSRERLAELSQVQDSKIKSKLQTEIDTADAKLRGAAREAYFRSIVELYQDDAWAADLVERARREIERK